MFSRKTETEKRLECFREWYPLIENLFQRAGGIGGLQVIGSVFQGCARDWSDIDVQPIVLSPENAQAAAVLESMIQELPTRYRIHIHTTRE